MKSGREGHGRTTGIWFEKRTGDEQKSTRRKARDGKDLSATVVRLERLEQVEAQPRPSRVGGA